MDAVPPPVDLGGRRHDPFGVSGPRPRRRTARVVHRRRDGPRIQRVDHRRLPERDVSLTTGHGPLSPQPAGGFIPAVPAGTVFVEPYPRRIRARIGERHRDRHRAR